MQRYTSQYQQSQIMTANPGELLLLTYDAAIRFLREAGDAMSRHDLYAQSTAVVRTQHILQYLRGTLNHDANPELADRLDGIYGYLLDELTQANIHDDLPKIESAVGLLATLRSAWEEAELQARGATPAAVGVPA